MNLRNYFDIARFWLLLKMELGRSKKGVLMTFVITFGLVFLSDLLEPIVENKRVLDSHTEGYAITLILVGFILSSLSFNDLTSTLRKYNYLTLPVSTLEKFLCMWLLTSIAWIIVFTLTYTIYALISNAINHQLFSQITILAFEPLGENATKTMKVYFVLQGIFLVGATHFKGYVFPKTLFTLVVFGLMVGTILYFTMKDVFLTDHDCTSIGECELLNAIYVHSVWLILQWLFWWVLAPLCWVITYLGLKEQEV